MKGLYEISIQNNKVKYEFVIRRNITIIQGDSATGKTTLVDMIREYQLNGQDSGISLSCKRKCVVLEGNDWEQNLSLYNDCIIFIDEGNKFISSKNFSSCAKKSTNYYVIVTREGLENLPYSVDEIYGIHTSGKYADLKQIYHEFFRIYDNKPDEELKIDKIITEDSNSGFEFFKAVADENIECISAEGKSNIFSLAKSLNPEGNILIVADGAAFGSQMNLLSTLVKQRKNLVLFLPESFEWLLLSSGILNDGEIIKILETPEEYIESKKFFSWEQYFTDLLIRKSDKTYLKYSKNKLNENYLAEKVKGKILNSTYFKTIHALLWH